MSTVATGTRLFTFLTGGFFLTGLAGSSASVLAAGAAAGKGKAKGGGGAVGKVDEPPDQPESNIAVS